MSIPGFARPGPKQADSPKQSEVTGSPERLRLMTSDQYLDSLVYIFGPGIKLDTLFPPLPRTDGLLENGAATVGVTLGQVEQYQRTAALVAARVVDPEHRKLFVACEPVSVSAADATCAAKFLVRFGRLWYRRPLSDTEVKHAVEGAGIAADRLKNFYAGLGIVLEAMLVDPRALFVADTSEPDPSRPGRRRLDAYSLASRLSLFLWNSAPDDTLLQAAESGEILLEAGRARVVDMMLASPRLETGVRVFFDDMLAFDDFSVLAKDPAVYPSFTGVTAADAREQTLRTVIDHLITKREDYRDLFTTRSTFISPALAALYRVPTTPGWQSYEFPVGSSRVGLLTQISFLSLHSHPGRSSPTVRGKALRELLLCQTVPRPPPNVDFSIVENPNSNYRTARDRLVAHRNNPVCAGCHKITDPVGLALEHFDGAGQYRETEKGSSIDVSGNIDGKEFKDAVGLGQALHDHPALGPCLVRRVYAYGTGGQLATDDRPALEYLNGLFVASGYRFPDLLRAVALSNDFSEVRQSKSPAGITAAAGVSTFGTQ